LKQGILFATPCYGGALTEPHFRACMNLKETLTTVGLSHDWLTGKNESLVHRARMEMVASFLKTDWSHLMWLDADIEFSPDDVARLWNLNKDVAVGAYQMKKRGSQAFAAWVNGSLIYDLNKFDKPTEVDFAGTGFMLIRREVLEGVYEHMKQLQSEVEQFLWKLAGPAPREAKDEAIIRMIIDRFAPHYEGPSGTVPALFMTPITNGVLDSEDYFFCRMARTAGFEIIMDPSIKLTHWGQYGYGQPTNTLSH
jgi:hypothetical protein